MQLLFRKFGENPPEFEVFLFSIRWLLTVLRIDVFDSIRLLYGIVPL